MGTHNPLHGMGSESSTNGYDDVYGPDNWRRHLVNKKPKDVLSKRFVVFLSFDVLTLFYFLRILDKISTAKEVIVLVLMIAYAAVRVAIGVIKLITFVGKNREGIKNGIKTIKEIFNE